MNIPQETASTEELLDQTQWLRSLARSLVSGEDRAEDLTQEVLLAAVRTPPQRETLRSWLHSVMHRLAARMHRSEERSRRRERDGARPEALPSAAELVATAQMQRSAVAAVLELDERFRTVLLLRFLEGASYADIATRLAIPIETVRSRIKRGLAQVRARLDRGHGSSRAWAVPLLGLGETDQLLMPTIPMAAVTSGVMLMSGMKKLCVAATVFIAVFFSYQAFSSAAVTPMTEAETQLRAANASPDSSSSPKQEAAMPPSRTALPDLDSVTANAMTVEGRLLSAETGAPLVDATVELRDTNSFPAAGPSEQTGFDGRFKIHDTRKGRKRGDVMLIHGASHAFIRRLIDVIETEVATTIDAGDIRVPVGTQFSGIVLDEHGAACQARLFLGEGRALSWSRRLCDTAPDGSFILPDRLAPSGTRSGWPDGGQLYLVAVSAKGVGWIELKTSRERTEQLGLQLHLAKTADLTVEIVDKKGEPVEGATVRVIPSFIPIGEKWRNDIYQGPDPVVLAKFRRESDEHGIAQFAALPAGKPQYAHSGNTAFWIGGQRFTVHAHRAGFKASVEAIKLEPGGNSVTITLATKTTLEVKGTVRDPEGRPISGAVITADDSSTQTNASGAYRFEGIPVWGSYLYCGATAQGHEHWKDRLSVPANSLALTWDVVLRPASDVIVRVIDGEGQPIPNANMSAWSEDEHHILIHKRVRSDADGLARLPSLPHGPVTLNIQPSRTLKGQWVGLNKRHVTVPSEEQVFRFDLLPLGDTRLLIELTDADSGKALDPRVATVIQVNAAGEPMIKNETRRIIRGKLPVILSFGNTLTKGAVARPRQVTKRSGLVSIDSVASGHWRVRVETAEGQRANRIVAVPEGVDVHRVRWALQRPAAIMMKVVWNPELQDDIPDRIPVFTYPPNAGLWEPSPGQERAGPRGAYSRGYVSLPKRDPQFRLGDIKPGTCVQFWVYDDEFYGEVTVNVTGSGDVESVLRLQRGAGVAFHLSKDLDCNFFNITIREPGSTEWGRPRFFRHPSDEVHRTVIPPGKWEWRLRSNDSRLKRTGLLDGVLGRQTDVHVK